MKSKKVPLISVVYFSFALSISLPALADKYAVAPNEGPVVGATGDSAPANQAFCHGFTNDEVIRRKKEQDVEKVYTEHKDKGEHNIKDSFRLYDRGMGTVYSFKGNICKKRVEKQAMLQLAAQAQANQNMTQGQAVETMISNVRQAENHYKEEKDKMEDFLKDFDDNKLEEGYQISKNKILLFKEEALRRGATSEANEAETKFKPEAEKGWKVANSDKETLKKVVKKLKDEKEVSNRKYEEYKRLRAELERTRSGLSVAQAN